MYEKSPERFPLNLLGKSIFGNIFGEETLDDTLPSTLTELFRTILLSFCNIVKSIVGTDEDFARNSSA